MTRRQRHVAPLFLEVAARAEAGGAGRISEPIEAQETAGVPTRRFFSCQTIWALRGAPSGPVSGKLSSFQWLAAMADRLRGFSFQYRPQ